MKPHQISLLGAIFFFLGVTLLLLSWNISYPIHLGALDELTFSQFSWLIWPGILFSSMGLFLAGYFSERDSVKAICASLFPLTLYVYVFYFSGTSTSDIGNVKSMFEVFHFTGIDSSVIPYFQYPTYFTLNEVTGKITGLDVNGIAMIFFALYGILLGLFLYLFLFKVTENNKYQIALLGVFIYFTISFSYLNYQWVPQTLALVFFFLLLITFNREGVKYKVLTLIFFIALIFTHIFIPVLFLLFFGLYSIKKRESLRMFVLLMCLYIAVLIYFTTYYFPQIISAFKETIYGFGEYSNTLSQSFKETTNFYDQLISLINRVRVPITLLFVSIGFVIGLIKKNIHYLLIMLAVVGGIYLLIGLVYPVLGLRALQILIISLVVGIGFFILKMKKPTMILVSVLIILSIFGSIRGSYDQTQFIVNEEGNTCHFLASSLSYEKINHIGLDQVDWGYFTNIEMYTSKGHSIRVRPTSIAFYEIFNVTMKNHNYVIYNSNLGKEIRDDGFISNYKDDILKTVALNNKIYSCGKTYVLTG